MTNKKQFAMDLMKLHQQGKVRFFGDGFEQFLLLVREECLTEDNVEKKVG